MSMDRERLGLTLHDRMLLAEVHAELDRGAPLGALIIAASVVVGIVIGWAAAPTLTALTSDLIGRIPT